MNNNISAKLNNILLLEDDPLLLQIISSLLSIRGYTMLQAGTLERAESILEQSSVDVLISDLYIDNEFVGLKFLEKSLKNLKANAGLLISGHPEACTHYSTRKLAEIQFLAKPFTEQQLIQTIDKLFTNTDAE